MKKYRYNIRAWVGGFVTVHVYIEADNLVKVSHERVKADGVVIDVPGEIKRITKRKAK